MFHLGSPDVLPTGDLGVRRGMQHLYGLKASAAGNDVHVNMNAFHREQQARQPAPCLLHRATLGAGAAQPYRHGGGGRELAPLQVPGHIFHVEGGRAALLSRQEQEGKEKGDVRFPAAGQQKSNLQSLQWQHQASAFTLTNPI